MDWRAIIVLVFTIGLFVSSRFFSIKNNTTVLAAYDRRSAVNKADSDHINGEMTIPNIKINNELPSTPTRLPSPTLSPTVPPSPTVVPTIAPLQADGSSSSNQFIDEINRYRESRGKNNLKVDKNACDFATLRAQEVTTDFSHEGFYKRQERNELPYPSYTKVSENIANASAGNPVSMWIASPTHEANLVQDVIYGCVGQSGEFYVFEGWTP